MCGIFGWQWNQAPTKADRIVLSTVLTIENESRGPHSWGYATSTRRDGIRLSKGTGTFSENHKIVELAGLKNVIAHTRWKTMGEVCPANAHPYRIGVIVGAHNGVIYNEAEIQKKYNRNFAVDSMNVFAHLDEDLPFNELRGYGSIEWFDSRYGQDSIFLCRMNDGELAIAKVFNHGYVWSSDKKHLIKALDCLDLRYSITTPKIGQVLELKHGNLLKTNQTLELAGNGKTWGYDSARNRGSHGGYSYDDTFLADRSKPSNLGGSTGTGNGGPALPLTDDKKVKKSLVTEGVFKGMTCEDHGNVKIYLPNKVVPATPPKVESPGEVLSTVNLKGLTKTPEQSAQSNAVELLSAGQGFELLPGERLMCPKCDHLYTGVGYMHCTQCGHPLDLESMTYGTC